MRFKGIIPPVATIVDDNGNLDKKGQANMIDALIRGGVNGLFFLGSASEAGHMDDRLRRDVQSFCISHNAGRLPSLVGAIGVSTRQVVEYAKNAEQDGADALVLLSPYYTAMSDEALFKHFATIAESVSIPSILYNLPPTTGNSLTPAMVKRLALEVPSVIGVKDTIDSLSHIRSLIMAVKPARPDFAIFAGFDEYIAVTLLLGGDGGVPASANFAPHLSCGIYQAYLDGDMARMQDCQRKLAETEVLFRMGPPFYAAMKEAARLAGVEISTAVLPPAQPVSEDDRRALAVMMKKIQP